MPAQPDTAAKTFEGVVSAVFQDTPNKYAVYIDGVRYSGFGKCPVSQGDTVLGTYIEKANPKGGVFLNIKTIRTAQPETKTTESLEPFLNPEEKAATSRNTQIARAVALKAAVDSRPNDVYETVTTEHHVSRILSVADAFLKWLEGGEKR